MTNTIFKASISNSKSKTHLTCGVQKASVSFEQAYI